MKHVDRPTKAQGWHACVHVAMVEPAGLPADVIAAVDKMAEFKVRNGDAFESMIRQKQRDNPKFAFLFDTSSPAHAYYQYKLSQFQQTLQPAPQPQPHALPNAAAPYYAPQMLPQPIAPNPQMQQHYHAPAPMPTAPMPMQYNMAPQQHPPAARPLSAMTMPVGLLATLLNERVQSGGRPLSAAPLRPNELPPCLPAIVPPLPRVLAAVERYYGGEMPLARAKPPPPPSDRPRRRERRSRSRSRSPRRAPASHSAGLGDNRNDVRGGGGGGLGGCSSAGEYERPLAAAQAEMGVREDGRYECSALLPWLRLMGQVAMACVTALAVVAEVAAAATRAAPPCTRLLLHSAFAINCIQCRRRPRAEARWPRCPAAAQCAHRRLRRVPQAPLKPVQRRRDGQQVENVLEPALNVFGTLCICT